MTYWQYGTPGNTESETGHWGMGLDVVILQASENFGPTGQVVIPSSLRLPLFNFLF